MAPSSKHTNSAADPAQLSFADALVFPGPQTVAGRGAAQVREALSLLPEHVPVFALKLVRTDYVSLPNRTKIRSPRDIRNLLASLLEGSDREQIIAVLLDTKNALIGLHVVSVGDLSSAVVHPREVFKAAILANAAHMVLAHNHPSGDPNPSPEDIAVTRRISEAGELLGIELLDHIVIGDAGRFTSIKEKGFF